MLPFLLAGNQCMFYREVLVSLWQIIIRFPPSKNVKKKKSYSWFCYQHFFIYLKLSFLILFQNIFGRYRKVSLFSYVYEYMCVYVCVSVPVSVCVFVCVGGRWGERVGCKFKSFRGGRGGGS